MHEIYGVNAHMSDVCAKYHASGHDVYCPNLSGTAKPFPYDQREAAYNHFVEHAGFDAGGAVDELAESLRGRYKQIFLLGFSVGATLAWRCSGSGLYDGAVCYYGSRIRDYREVIPACPVLLVFARHEPSFSPEGLLSALSGTPHVSGRIFEARHGFCDTHSPDYNEQAAAEAEILTRQFFHHIQGEKAS